MESSNVTLCKLLFVFNRDGTNRAKLLTLWETYTDDWQHFQNRGCLMEKQRRHHNSFHGRADCDSGASQIANMQHTHRCTRHRGEPMPECPSQWGCPVKSLGMSALLCFYTQVERWIWSRSEMCVQGKKHRNANTVRDQQATTTDKWRSRQTAWRGGKETKALMELLLQKWETNNI